MIYPVSDEKVLCLDDYRESDHGLQLQVSDFAPVKILGIERYLGYKCSLRITGDIPRLPMDPRNLV